MATKKGQFTVYLKRIHEKMKDGRVNADYDIDEEFLQELWDQQQGKCAITKIPLVIKTNSKWMARPEQASIDRIRNDVGYTKDNIQFVAYSVNLAKSTFDNQTIIEFFEAFKLAQNDKSEMS